MLFLILSGCSNKNITISEINDPLEDINRKIFNFNRSVDEKVISPISASYKKITPPSTRKAIGIIRPVCLCIRRCVHGRDAGQRRKNNGRRF